jgi:hypothetical protein
MTVPPHRFLTVSTCLATPWYSKVHTVSLPILTTTLAPLRCFNLFDLCKQVDGGRCFNLFDLPPQVDGGGRYYRDMLARAMELNMSEHAIAEVRSAAQAEEKAERQALLQVCEGCQADLACAHAMSFALCLSSTACSV